MGKVVLVRPLYYDENSIEVNERYIYLGVLGVAAAVRKAGHDVVLIDPQVRGGWRDELARETKDALYVGISAMVTQVGGGVEAAKVAKSVRPDVPVVWGGVHASILPAQTVKSQWCDVAVIGEGDDAAAQLADAYEKGLPIDDVPGIGFERDGRFVCTPKTKILMDLDQLEVPAYDLYTREEMEDFIKPLTPHPVYGKLRTITIECGRGCTFQCTFCINTALNEKFRKHRVKSAERIVAEMEEIGGRYNIENFMIMDEDFFTGKERVMEFLDLYEKKGFKYSWCTAARANYFRDNYVDRKFAERLAKCGCNHVGVGVESGSINMLKRMKKGITPELVLRSARTVAGTGLYVGYSLMIGMPGEEREDVVETLKIMWNIRHIAPENSFLVGPQLFRPYPGSKMYEEAIAMGLQQPDTLEGWADAGLSKWGYLNIENMPWVKNIDLFNYIMELLPFLLVGKRVSRFYAAKVVLRMFFKPITYLRIKTNFWRYFFELHLFRLVKRFVD